MPDTTLVDSIRFRDLARRIEAERVLTEDLTPAGALTTIAGALKGSLIEECHGAVSVDIGKMQSEVESMCRGEIDSLLAAADSFDEQEQANIDALRQAGGPR